MGENLYHSRKIWIFTFNKNVHGSEWTISLVREDKISKNETSWNHNVLGDNNFVFVVFLSEK